MEFSRQEYWSELLFPSPGDLPDPGIEPGSPTLQTDSLPSELQGNFCVREGALGSLQDITSLTRDWRWAKTVKAPGSNHWTAREFLITSILELRKLRLRQVLQLVLKAETWRSWALGWDLSDPKGQGCSFHYIGVAKKFIWVFLYDVTENCLMPRVFNPYIKKYRLPTICWTSPVVSPLPVPKAPLHGMPRFPGSVVQLWAPRSKQI